MVENPINGLSIFTDEILLNGIVVSWPLNRLGILNFEVGKLANSKEFYLEAIKLQTELNDISGIIGSIHRAFALFEDSERDNY